MTTLTDSLLPDEVDSLKAIIAHERATKAAALSERDAEIERLRAQVRVLLAERFGPKAERVATAASPQLGLFNEAEVEDEEEVDEAVTAVAPHTRRRGHRQALPAHLPREEVVHDP